MLFIPKEKNLKYKKVVLPENVNNKKMDIMMNVIGNLLPFGRNAPTKNNNVESKSVHTRLKRNLASGSLSTGIMPKICVFCTKKNEKHKDSKQKLVSVETGESEEHNKKYATNLGDQALLSKLESVDFVPKETLSWDTQNEVSDSCRASFPKTSPNKETAKRSINLCTE